MLKHLYLASVVILLLQMTVQAQDPKQTEDWSHKPVKVEPGRRRHPPSDAIVLFRTSKDIRNWKNRNDGPAQWKTFCNQMIVNGTGDIHSKEVFGDCQLHIEFKTPRGEAGKSGQGKGNSGIYFQQRYEVQVLDSYKNETYFNGQAGAIYKQSAPLVNASLKPGKWQRYDIIFRAPKFTPGGSLSHPAYLTVFHNGVLIQDHFELKGSTTYAGYPRYEVHGDAPLKLQDHGNRVHYRNIWIRKL